MSLNKIDIAILSKRMSSVYIGSVTVGFILYGKAEPKILLNNNAKRYNVTENCVLTRLEKFSKVIIDGN